MIVYDADSMDPLDEVLHGLRVRGAMVGVSKVDPPWALAVDTDDPVRLLAVVGGSGWLVRAGHEPVRLDEGTIAVVVGAGRLVACDDLRSVIELVITGADVCIDPKTGESRLEHERIAPRSWGNSGAAVDVLVGGYQAEGQRFASLASDLPDLIIVSGDPVARSALASVTVEALRDEPGQQTVFDRLMELLLFTTVRTWLASSYHPLSWYGALGDPRVGPALRAMHDDPARRWTVADLAAVAAQSRAAFARRFNEVVGEPPMSYLTRWRLTWACDLLIEGSSVQRAAREVGYSDPYAFSTAFRRQFGRTPTDYRRLHGAGAQLEARRVS